MSHIRRRAQLFLIQPFRWFIISNLLATFGNGLAYIAMTWLVLQAHNAVSAVAMLMICFWLPSIILSPWAGVIGDRYSRKVVSIITTSIRALILILFPLIFKAQLSAVAIYVLAALMGALLSIYTPASMALVREIVHEQDLLYANTTLDITYELGHMVGMGSAGFIISYFSAETAIILNGILFVAATLALIWMKSSAFAHKFAPKESASFCQQSVEGLRYLAQNKSLGMLYFIQLLIMIIFMTSPILLAPFAKNILHANVIEFGAIEAALSIGIVVGGLFLPYYAEKIGATLVVMFGCIIAAICFLIFGMTTRILIAEIMYLIIGICLAVWAIIITKAQVLTDINYQSRVQAAFNALAGTGILGIYLIMHYFGDTISVAYLYGFESAIAILAALLIWRYRNYLKHKP